jgi:hypothetical protein
LGRGKSSKAKAGKVRAAKGGIHTTKTESCNFLQQHLVADAQQVSRQWQFEDYAVLDPVVDYVLQLMRVRPKIDCFATSRNRRFARWWGQGSPECCDAFSCSWAFGDQGLLWANPPYSMMTEVIAKLKGDGAHMLVVSPKWETKQWFKQLEDMTVLKCVCPEGSTVFQRDGVQCRGVKWPVVFALCCGHSPTCSQQMVLNGGLSRAQKRKLRQRQVRERCRDQAPASNSTDDHGLQDAEVPGWWSPMWACSASETD